MVQAGDYNDEITWKARCNESVKRTVKERLEKREPVLSLLH